MLRPSSSSEYCGLVIQLNGGCHTCAIAARLRPPPVAGIGMSKCTNRRWIERTSEKAGAALRFCLAVYLILQIVCTPLHLYLEPHSDFVADEWTTSWAQTTAEISCQAHHSDSDHERHSASHHALKALRTQRTPVVDMVFVMATECLPPAKPCLAEEVSVFSGLSPPELPRSWQFVLRTALPVRAPSFPS